MNIKSRVALLVGKLASAGLAVAHKTGETLPGALAERVSPEFLGQIGQPNKIVFVSGTNGKTTTSNMLDDILVAAGYDPITNRTGSNISRGIATALINNATLSGRQKRQFACLELDELYTRRVLPYVHADMLVVTALYRDDFMRNADPDYMFGVMDASIQPATHLVLNADDLISCRLGRNCEKRTFYSVRRLPESFDGPEGIVCDLNACPECGHALEYDYAHIRHLGHAHCTHCGLTNPAADYEVISYNHEDNTFVMQENKNGGAQYTYPGPKFYSITNLYNMTAALVGARELGISPIQLQTILHAGKVGITRARFSEEAAGGKRLVNIASKGENGTATATTIAAIVSQPGPKAVYLTLADAYLEANPKEEENTGWYYQADFEYLAAPEIKQIVISGATKDDLMLRLLLAGIPAERIQVAANPIEAANMIELDGIDGVYCAFDVFNGDQADAFRARVAERLS